VAALPNGNCRPGAYHPRGFNGLSTPGHEKRVLNYLSYVALEIPRALFAPCDVVVAMTDPPLQGIVGAIVATLKRKRMCTTSGTCTRTWPWGLDR